MPVSLYAVPSLHFAAETGTSVSVDGDVGTVTDRLLFLTKSVFSL
jgi:hypothetical protein